jgi:hypothetical protein
MLNRCFGPDDLVRYKIVVNLPILPPESFGKGCRALQGKYRSSLATMFSLVLISW